MSRTSKNLLIHSVARIQRSQRRWWKGPSKSIHLKRISIRSHPTSASSRTRATSYNRSWNRKQLEKSILATRQDRRIPRTQLLSRLVSIHTSLKIIWKLLRNSIRERTSRWSRHLSVLSWKRNKQREIRTRWSSSTPRCRARPTSTTRLSLARSPRVLKVAYQVTWKPNRLPKVKWMCWKFE